jgi:hypothetical protein
MIEDILLFVGEGVAAMFDGKREPNEQQSPGAATPIPKSNVLATVGLLTSLLGIVTCGLISPLGALLSLIALRNEPRRVAIVGLVIGSLGSIWLFSLGYTMFAAIIGYVR